MTRPTRACICRLEAGEVRAAIWAKGSPDEQQQAAWFDARHQGPGHERVERLPKEPGQPDIPWGSNGV